MTDPKVCITKVPLSAHENKTAPSGSHGKIIIRDKIST